MNWESNIVALIPWEGKGYPLQYSGLENSMDCYSAWRCKELDTTEQLSHIYHHVWNRWLVGCYYINQRAQSGVPWWPGGVDWGWWRRLKKEGTYIYLWLIQVIVWQKPIQHCKAIILQLKLLKRMDFICVFYITWSLLFSMWHLN